MPWARPGGPSDDLAWAGARLAAANREVTGRPEQIRSWNLSSLWRLRTNRGDVWLKHVPAFFAHEGAVIRALGDAPVPTLIATEAGRSLMAAIPGEDQYDAGVEILGAGVDLLVTLQAEWATRVDELETLGLPDWRPASLAPAIEDVVRRTAVELSTSELRSLERLIDGLPDRFVELAACGLPETLVHGDFSPGNLRGDERRLVLLDWGDSGIGNPLFDQAAMLDRAPPGAGDDLEERWADRWRRMVPRSDPRRAAVLIGPVAACRQAVIYRGFLDRIEASEHPYHRSDPALWLQRAAARMGD
jgi:hypothetical protein